MDNITHSLFGAAVSETTWAFLPAPSRERLAPSTRKAMLLASVVGNNMPDLDFLYARWMHANPQLGNLLHHRGHTHTIAIAFLQSLLLFGLCVAWKKWRKKSQYQQEWKLIGFLAFLGPLTHMLLDWLNNYGVHPFWPLDNSWKYGDWIFVLEPWAWVTLSIALFLGTRNRKARFVFGSIPFLGFLLAWGLGVVPTLMSATLTVWALGFYLLVRNRTSRMQFTTAWTALALLLGLFQWGHSATETILRRELTDSEYTLEDSILSPLPVNPFCWAVVTVESQAAHYRLKRAVVAPFPRLISLETCTHLRFFAPEVSRAPTNTWILWEKEHLVDRTELETLRSQYCDVQDFLRFSRAPYFWRDATDLYFSDLRFERSQQRSFARVKISRQAPPCPDSRAPWEPPLPGLKLFPAP